MSTERDAVSRILSNMQWDGATRLEHWLEHVEGDHCPFTSCAGPKVRPPFKREQRACLCAAMRFADSAEPCNRWVDQSSLSDADKMRARSFITSASNARACSGFAASPNTVFAPTQAKSSVSTQSTSASRNPGGKRLLTSSFLSKGVIKSIALLRGLWAGKGSTT